MRIKIYYGLDILILCRICVELSPVQWGWEVWPWGGDRVPALPSGMGLGVLVHGLSGGTLPFHLLPREDPCCSSPQGATHKV